MKRIVTTAISLLLLIGFVVGLRAQNVVYVGLGGMTCGAWLDSRNSGRPAAAEIDSDLHWWIQGFVEGAAKTMELGTPKDSPNVLYARVEQYCASHRNEDLVEATSMVVLQIYGRRH